MGAGFGVTGAAVAILLSVLLAEAHALPPRDSSTGGPCAGRGCSQPAGGKRERRTRNPGARWCFPTPSRDPTSDLQPAPSSSVANAGRWPKTCVSALIALALLAILQNFDVVLLGRAAPGNAGSYAPISVACKPLVLAAFVLAGFLLPEAASRRHAGQHALRQLGVVLAVIADPPRS